MQAGQKMLEVKDVKEGEAKERWLPLRRSRKALD